MLGNHVANRQHRLEECLFNFVIVFVCCLGVLCVWGGDVQQLMLDKLAPSSIPSRPMMTMCLLFRC